MNAELSTIDSARLVEQASDAMIFADRGGVIRIWNPAAERIFGYPAATSIGQNLDIIIPEDLREAHWTGYNRALVAGDTKYRGQSLSTKALKQDGSQIYVELSFAIVRGCDAEVVGAMAQARDITERFERDRTMRRCLRELETAQRARGGSSMTDALFGLHERQGPSPWLDFIRRDMLENGGLNATSRRSASDASRPTQRSSNGRSMPEMTMTRKSEYRVRDDQRPRAFSYGFVRQEPSLVAHPTRGETPPRRLSRSKLADLDRHSFPTLLAPPDGVASG